MKWLEAPGAVAAGCALVLLANLAILGAAAANRSGEPGSELSLTERELAVPPARWRDEGGVLLSLRLTHEASQAVRQTARWRGHDLPPVRYSWLDLNKLRELGFRTDVEPDAQEADTFYRHAMVRRGFVVLEYDGPAWQRWMAGREKEVEELRHRSRESTADGGALADAEALLALDRTTRSRLFPVDAGTDAAVLLRRYPDRHRDAVVEAFFHPQVVHPEDGGAPFLTGSVAGLAVHVVQVPRALRPALEPFLPHETWDELFERQRQEARSGWPDPEPPRYTATLAFGARHEPWLESVAALTDQAPADP